MRLWADDTGAIREFDITYEYVPETAYPRVFEFDERTNRALARDLLDNMGRYVVALPPSLLHDGVPVVVQPGGQQFNDYQNLLTVWTKLQNDQMPTNAELLKVLRLLCRKTGLIKYIQGAQV